MTADNSSFVCDSAETLSKFVPSDNVTEVRVASSMEQIPARAFKHKFIQELADLTMEEGVQVIGEEAFSMGWALGNVRLPSTVREIRKDAFAHCVLQLKSVELSPNPLSIGNTAFQGCARLRNIAIAESDKKLGKRIFKGCHNLSKVFSDPEDLLQALVHRFDDLPIHKVCYYQSYDSAQTALQKLQTAIQETSSSSSSNQDCLGMTPLHILALSKTQRLELYQACVEQHPEDLVAQDKWKTLPIHYACENNAPLEVIQYLMTMQESKFPKDVVDWNDFLLKSGPEFFGKAPLPEVKLLLNYQKRHCPNKLVDWKHLIHDVNCFGSIDVFRYVVQESLADRIQALEVGSWRDEITAALSEIPEASLYTAAWIQEPSSDDDNETSTGVDHVDHIQAKLAKYENLNQTCLLELAFWKLKMQSEGNNDDTSDEDFRKYCHIHTGAEHMIPNVLSFLP